MLLFLLLAIDVYARTPELNKAAIESFVQDGLMTERELLLLKGRLRRLAVSHSRALSYAQKSPAEEQAAVAFSHDHTDEEVSPNTDTEEAINDQGGLSEYLYQGDILLTPEQALDKIQTKHKRAALPPFKAKTAKWDPERIGYYFHNNVPTNRRLQIEETLNYYRNHTCLRFVRSWPSKVEVVLRFRMSDGCWSYVGKMSFYQADSSNQDIGFHPYCFNQFGTISHEIMHALGFQHEHVRKDRDGYVVVNFGNVWKNDTYNYEKDGEGDYQGFDYELGSIMHYGEQGDPFNLEKAKIYTKDYKKLLTIGNRMFPTFQDIAQINTFYGCYDKCKNVTNNCKNSGLPHVNDCSRCECPHGFGGKFCTEVEPSTKPSPTCGGILEAKVGEEQTFTGQVNSTDYMQFMVDKCYWHIRAPAGKKVKMFVKESSMSCTAGCPWNALEVKEGNFSVSGTRKCCTRKGTSYDYFTSLDNLIVVGMFTKNGPVSATWTYRAE